MLPQTATCPGIKKTATSQWYLPAGLGPWARRWLEQPPIGRSEVPTMANRSHFESVGTTRPDQPTRTEHKQRKGTGCDCNSNGLFACGAGLLDNRVILSVSGLVKQNEHIRRARHRCQEQCHAARPGTAANYHTAAQMSLLRFSAKSLHTWARRA